jgi:hypothetical protein
MWVGHALVGHAVGTQMDQQTLELLRVLQSGERDPGTLRQLQALLPPERARLTAADDRATLADISELLEVWADTAPPPLAAAATAEAAEIADTDLEQAERAIQLYRLSLERAPAELEALRKLEALLRRRGEHERLEAALGAHAELLSAARDVDPALVAEVLRRLGKLRAERGKDLGAAIDAYERALDLAADTDVIHELAALYAQRGSNGDAAQAADLYCTLGDALGAVEGAAMLERALDLAPAHDAALELLETYLPAADQAQRLIPRWTAFVESSDDEQSTDQRRLLLAHAHAALGHHREALISLGPLIDKSDAEALRLQAAYLASLQEEQAAAEPTKARAGNGAPVRPPTLVGFRVPAPEEPSAADGSYEDDEDDGRDQSARSEPPAPTREELEAAAAQPVLKLRASVAAGAARAADEQAAQEQDDADEAHDSQIRPSKPHPARSGETLVGFRLPEELTGTDAPSRAASVERSPTEARAGALSRTPSREPQPQSGASSTATRLKPAPDAPSRGAVRTSKQPSASSARARPAVEAVPKPAAAAPSRASQGPAAAAAAMKAAALKAGRASSSAPPSVGSAPPHAAPIVRPAALVAPAPAVSAESGSSPAASSMPPPLPRVAPQPAPEPQTEVDAWSASEQPFEARAAAVLAEFSSPAPRGPRASRRWLMAAGGAAALVVLAIALALGTRHAPPPPPATRSEAVAPQAAAPPPAVVPEPPPVVAAPAAVAPPPAVPAASPAEPAVSKKTAKAKSAAKLSAGRAHVIGGGLSAQQIALVLEDTLPAIERCYATALAKNPKLEGRVVFGWTVGKSGLPTHVRKLSATLKDDKVQRCSLDALRKTHFPKPKKKTSDVTWPLDYQND